MTNRKSWLFALALVPLLVTGCASTVTNLTPRQLARTPNNLYPFEAMFDTTEQSVRKDTVKGYVIVGLESYPMQQTPMLKNRWETLVPVPADKKLVNYRYKFDYEYLSIPTRRSNSKLSPPYQLEIVDR